MMIEPCEEKALFFSSLPPFSNSVANQVANEAQEWSGREGRACWIRCSQQHFWLQGCYQLENKTLGLRTSSPSYVNSLCSPFYLTISLSFYFSVFFYPRIRRKSCPLQGQPRLPYPWSHSLLILPVPRPHPYTFSLTSSIWSFPLGYKTYSSFPYFFSLF